MRPIVKRVSVPFLKVGYEFQIPKDLLADRGIVTKVEKFDRKIPGLEGTIYSVEFTNSNRSPWGATTGNILLLDSTDVEVLIPVTAQPKRSWKSFVRAFRDPVIFTLMVVATLAYAQYHEEVNAVLAMMMGIQ